MPIFNRKKMCSECPFRKASVRGYLGPHTPEHLESLAKEDVGFICHKSVNRLMEKGMSSEEIEVKGQHCVGILRYMNGMLKASRDSETYTAQHALMKVKDQEVIEPGKFIEHHTPHKKE